MIWRRCSVSNSSLLLDGGAAALGEHPHIHRLVMDLKAVALVAGDVQNVVDQAV